MNGLSGPIGRLDPRPGGGGLDAVKGCAGNPDVEIMHA